MFIPERQREALMRLTMCARDECMMCIYQPKDDRCKDIATTAMHILANALKVDDDDTPQTDCETCKYGEDKHRYAHICNECGVGINNYTPQTESTGSPIGDYRDGVGAWQTDCGWGEPNE